MDYAATHIGDFYRHQLEAGGATAIARDAWSDHVTECDHWALVGVPSETVVYDGTTIITARMVMSPLTPAKEPTLAGEKAQNQFYAKPIYGSEHFFNDADGMSGGPVFALKQQGRHWAYSVIGVQSAWYSTSRILAICPFTSFGLALEEVVAEVLAPKGQPEGTSSAA